MKKLLARNAVYMPRPLFLSCRLHIQGGRYKSSLLPVGKVNLRTVRIAYDIFIVAQVH